MFYTFHLPHTYLVTFVRTGCGDDLNTSGSHQTNEAKSVQIKQRIAIRPPVLLQLRETVSAKFCKRERSASEGWKVHWDATNCLGYRAEKRPKMGVSKHLMRFASVGPQRANITDRWKWLRERMNEHRDGWLNPALQQPEGIPGPVFLCNCGFTEKGLIHGPASTSGNKSGGYLESLPTQIYHCDAIICKWTNKLNHRYVINDIE